MISLLPLFGLILPFFCWAVEVLLPYPYVVEELGKAIFIILVWRFPHRLTQIKVTVLMAVFFAFSESVFYLFNIYSVGNLQTFFLRLLLTIPLHTVTSLIILLPTMKNKKLILPGTILAIIMHYLYNSLIPSIVLTP